MSSKNLLKFNQFGVEMERLRLEMKIERFLRQYSWISKISFLVLALFVAFFNSWIESSEWLKLAVLATMIASPALMIFVVIMDSKWRKYSRWVDFMMRDYLHRLEDSERSVSMLNRRISRENKGDDSDFRGRDPDWWKSGGD